MPRSLSLFTACALALIFCLPGRGQDSPSLGDIARQAQKDKANAPAKKVVTVTNDDLPSGSGSGSSAFGGGFGSSLGPVQAGQPVTSTKPSPAASPTPAQGLERMEALMNQLDSLDRATLVKAALQGSNADFPGRMKWEDRLMEAKETYASRGHELLQRARQIVASAERIQGSQDPSDPRVKDLAIRLRGLIEDGVRADAAFQAVILEGRDMASQAAAH